MAKDTNDGRLALAKEGENLAVRFLERLGYAIVARNVRTRWGEVDVVARDGATWVFVEVKTRRSDRYGPGAEAVTHRKQRHILRMAQLLLVRYDAFEAPARCDVVEVMLRPGHDPAIRHLPNAFGE